mmetsp:Transcript_44607/g.111914  ORF Transcript_44607/g.111914 Transcript_44607/m.111914 type:complete len:457 (-) Transcript_44607:313-1683(-)
MNKAVAVARDGMGRPSSLVAAPVRRPVGRVGSRRSAHSFLRDASSGFCKQTASAHPLMASRPPVGRKSAVRPHAGTTFGDSLQEAYSDQAGGRAAPASREEHAAAQAAFLTAQATVAGQGLPEAELGRVETALGGLPGLGPHSRVIIAGSQGTTLQQLAAVFQAQGVADILAVDVCAEAPASVSTCGNDLALRSWAGDLAELPDYLGGADAIVFCGSLGRMFDVRQALLRCSLLLKPGGAVAICEPLGYAWQRSVAEAAPMLMPHTVPAGDALVALVADLALQVEQEEEAPGWGFACLRVPPDYSFPAAPLYLQGDVTTGFGRGSRQMGVPTANLPPEPLVDAIESLPNGVYFGWAQLVGGAGSDGDVHKMVMNIGQRPTCEDGGGRTVEVHVLHAYGADFYGERMKALAMGYLRPEMKFDGFPALVARIRADIGIAKYMLDTDGLAAGAQDAFFR